MKRLLTLAAMFLCCMATTFAQYSGSGSGTESDPYLILNPIQLNQLRNFLNQNGVYFKLMADIDLTEFLEDENPSQGWQPVGNSSASFKGIVDGNGKTVSGLWIKRANTDYVGFFGNTNGATIKNLKIVATTIVGKDYVGGISGNSSNTTITGSSFTGTIGGVSCVGGFIGSSGDNLTLSNNTAIVAVTSSGDYVGGFVGKNDALNNLKISDCSLYDGTIVGTNYVGGCCGGIVGSHYNNNSITNTYIHADITGKQRVGGICGFSENISHTINLKSCGYLGKIDGETYVGGLVGYVKKENANSNDNIEKSFAIGCVSASKDYVGGIVGFDQGQWGRMNGVWTDAHTNLSNCYYSGTISGKSYVGGLVGYKQYGEVSKNYAVGSVSGVKYVGGLIGKNNENTTLKSSVAINTRVTTTEGIVNRIVGENNGSIGTLGTSDENKSYNRTIVINQGVAQEINDDLLNGTGVSAKTLKLKATYVAMGWDFTDTWDIQETECYPYMKSQTAPPVITSQLVSGATTISGKCVDGGTVTIEVDGVTQQMVSTGHEFSFNVSPLQAGHEVRISAKAEEKEQSYYTTEVVSYLGKGTEDDPYQVYTASDLTGVYRKGYFKLMNDIDLTDYINQFSPTEGWESIGREGSETIHFDGNGYKITGLWCNSTRDNTGLFSCFANGTIKNLTVETAKNKQVKGGANTGILIGKMINGTIENCQVLGTLSDGTPVGGMVGLLDGGKISLSQANVTINTTVEQSYVGGLVGEITGGEIDQCVTQGTITATGKESYVGGLVGRNSATVTNSYSNVVVTSTYNAAGLIAYNYGVVDKCYAVGNIFSSNYGAGVIGYNDGENAVVKNCVAMNNKIDVTWESQQQQQGGGYGQRIIGGIKNGAPAPELNNYALKTMQVSLNNVPQKVYDDIMNGVAKTATELVDARTYQELGWDFADIWFIDENGSYPSLRNNEAAVGKPSDESPETPISTDDKISVQNVEAYKGKTATFSVCLDNKATDLCAYQFDLTLPTGITLSKDDNNRYQVTKTSRYDGNGHSLEVTLLEGNTYRFICYSMPSKLITGTGGALLNAIIEVDKDQVSANYDVKIGNIIMTKMDGNQIKLNDIQFVIEVKKAMKGDANADGEINVGDVVEIVKAALNKPTAKFVKEAADMNNDNEINVTDVVMVVNIIMSADVNSARTKTASGNDANDWLSLTNNDQQMLSLTLHNKALYTGFQFDMKLSSGQTLESINLNSLRSRGHVLTYTEIGENMFRVIVYSTTNSYFEGNGGELLNFKISGNGNVEIDNILFIQSNEQEKKFSPLYGGTTGIQTVEKVQAADIYGIDGRLVRSQAVNTNGLEKGIYIINGKKHIVK